MKSQVRVLGIDDAPFKFSDDYVLVIGAIVRLPNYLEGVMRTRVEVDGNDATGKLASMVNHSRYKEQLELIVVDGIALGGFNIIDMEALRESTGIPVCTVTRDKPDMASIEKALRKKFPDWKDRLKLMTQNELVRISTEHNPVYVNYSGMELPDLKDLIRRSTVKGAIPEPIRMAHLIASALETGESYGRA